MPAQHYSSVVIDTRPLRQILLERAVRPGRSCCDGARLLVHRRRARRPKGSRLGPPRHGRVRGVPRPVGDERAAAHGDEHPGAGAAADERRAAGGKVYGLFGNEAVFFILGVFILAACLMKSRLSTRLALATLHRFGHSPRTLLLSASTC